MQIRFAPVMPVMVVALALLLPSAAMAQGTGTQKPAPQTTKPKPRAPKLPLGLRAFVAVDSTSMSASSTFKGHTGSSRMTGFGVGGEVLNLWRQMFLRTGFSTISAGGTRGFVVEGQFVSTGVPLETGVRHFELAAGWRTYLKKHPRAAWYVAGGLDIGTHRQESPNAQAGENDSQSGSGAVVLAGFEFTVRRPIVAGLEIGYRSVGGVLGESGTSQSFGEDNLGGFAVRGLVGVRFRR